MPPHTPKANRVALPPEDSCKNERRTVQTWRKNPSNLFAQYTEGESTPGYRAKGINSTQIWTAIRIRRWRIPIPTVLVNIPSHIV